jgi:hypothetical protein
LTLGVTSLITAQAAVEAIVAADALASPKWRNLDYLIADTQSLFQLGMLNAAQDIAKAQADMMETLK